MLAENGDVKFIEKEATWRSCRVMLAIVGFFGTVLLYALRMNMSIAIICMTNHTAVKLEYVEKNAQNMSTISDFVIYNQSKALDNSTSTSIMKSCQSLNPNTNYIDGAFPWNSETRGIILGVFFWGYLVSQIPAGILAQRVGAKMIILILSLITTLSTLLLPIAAQTNLAFLIILRIACGIGSGVWFPCFHHLWSRWAPPNERTKLVGFTYAGVHIGNAVTLPIAGYLCQYGFAGGWPSIFYIFGLVSLVWCILWGALIFDGPESHPRVSKYEKNLIQTSLAGQIEEKDTEVKIPIKSILLSPPVWAIIVVNITFDWNGYLFLTSVPTYMKDLLKMDMSESAGLSSLPYIGFWIGHVTSAFFCDFLRDRQILSVTWIRKLMTLLGMFGPGILVVVLGYLTCENKYWAVAILTLGLALNGAVFAGCFVNHVDIAPRYAGLLCAISNTLGSITGIFSPIVVGALTEQNLQSQWRSVFFISAAIYAFGGIFYLIFGSGEMQPWAVTSSDIKMIEINKDLVAELEPLKEKEANGMSTID